jgi:hypothetical protein
VNEHHEWSRVAKLYVDAIERCHEETASGAGNSAERRLRATSWM